MLSTILRRSFSPSLLAPSRALCAITHLHHNQFAPATSPISPRNGSIFCETRPLSSLFGSLIKGRDFHVKSGPLNFKASVATQAEFAIADYGFDEEKGKGAEEGLEISKLGISPEIGRALEKKGITKLFPIQKAVLEPAMQGRDLFGRARTGTGKTLAFGIPIIDKILQFNEKHGKGRNPLALVMAPTRELAKQVDKEFSEAAPSLDTICLYGGTPIAQQMRSLDYGVDIAVGTPGRIIDLMNRGSLILSEVKFVVLDEADQMLNVGFVEDIEKIFQKLPQNRQSMCFSATMPSWIRNLIRNYLKDPLTIDLVGDSDKKLADGITLYSITSDSYARASILGPLITEHAKGGKCIIFTQTKRDADRLAYAMAKNHKCEALHGDISQSMRERTLSGFRNGHFNILVATDVAARGLDVPNVDLVIHYEIPNSSETFVHRSGRTGRAGKKGTAILIYTQEEGRKVQLIERDTGCRFSELPRIAVDGATMDMGGGYGRYNSFGGYRDRRPGQGSYGSGQHYGNSGFGRSDGYSGQFSGPGRSGYNRNQQGNFGEHGFGRSGGFGESGRADRLGRSSTFGNFGSGRPSGFGDNNSRRSGGSQEDSFFNRFGDFGDSRS